MKKSFYYILIIISVCAFDKSYSQKVLTLDDAVTIALNQNTNVVKSTNSIATFQAGVKSAYGNLLPNLNIGGGFGWQKTSDNGGRAQIDYFGNPQILGPSENDSRSWSISAGGGVTLFNGLSNIAQINKSKSDLESAKLSLEKLKQDVVLQTVNLYAQIISYKKLLGFQESDLKYNEGLIDQIKQKYNLKSVALSDVYSQEAQTANSKVSYLRAKNNFEKAKINLLTYLSIDLSKNYEFDSVLTSTNTEDLVKNNLNYLYNYALENRQDYLSIKYQQTSTQSQLTIARSGLFPILSANYGFSTSATKPSDLMSRRVYSLGLSLNIPVFSNWNTENSIQAAEVQVQNNNEDVKALELNIKSQVASANLDLQTAQQQLDASEIALTASKESWKIKKETYVLGGATYLDLQQSYNIYLQAEYNRINNEYSYMVAQYALLNAISRY
jgi:outer membrane protein